MSTEIQGADLHALRANKLDLVERLTDDLAHEIKNPLHSMVINLEVLKRRIARSERDDTEDLARYARVLGSELERVNRRVELLLRLVRGSRGAEPITLGEAAADLIDLIELERERREVELHYEPAAYAGRGYLPADVARQAVLNLVLAALDALRPGDLLEIRVGQEAHWERLRVGGVRAPGRPPEPSSARRLDGGDERLAAARALVEGLGGRLEVRASDAAPDLLLALPITR